ncbi:MAG: phosphodiester glycosidase family protein, partial [Muribaculaceae bacterium]|nr:phosphodiester glycosidase family protein [Muribaculaceae bacterium]
AYSPAMFITRVAGNETGSGLGNIAADNDAVFAINGCAADFLMVDNQVLIDNHLGGDNSGVLAISEKSGEEVSEIIMCTPAEYDLLKSKYTHVLAGGTMLVNDGEEIDQPVSERMARTLIGTDKTGNMIMMTIDANTTGNADGATLAEAAFIARVSGMINAINLDGGDRSGIWINDGNSASPAGAETVIYAIYNTPFDSGNGSASDPYVIKSRRHLSNMQASLVADQTVYFELGADIDMNGLDWTPLNYASPYNLRIVFDGKGHTLSNFHCEYPEYPSFFGVLYGECRNVFFDKASIIQEKKESCFGIIAGYVGTGGKPGLVEQVRVDGELISGPSTSPQMGGLGGQLNEGTIRNCYANVTMTRHQVKANVGCGGIAGRVRTNSTIENCYATGSIDVIKYDNAGSIWGRAEDNQGWTLRNNIGWMSSITAAWASNAVGGRTINKAGNNTLGDNYGNQDIVLTLFQDDTPSQPYDENYKGSLADRSIAGTPTNDIIDAARKLGWDENIWNLSGDMPRLRWEK